MELKERIQKSIEDAKHLYQKLILLVGRFGSGKTSLLRNLSIAFEVPVVNVNMEISSHLLDVPVEKRASVLPQLFPKLLIGPAQGLLLMDNLEILFDPTLHQNPLSLLQSCARNRVLIAAWPGHIENGRLIHATPDHPEYWAYPIENTGITFDLNSTQDP